MAGLGGIVITARVQSATPALGMGYELDAIASAVIGGTSFAGGIGTVWGIVVGALIIGVMNNGLDLLNVSPFYQRVVQGRDHHRRDHHRRAQEPLGERQGRASEPGSLAGPGSASVP